MKNKLWVIVLIINLVVLFKVIYLNNMNNYEIKKTIIEGLTAPRGRILDAKGNILVDNKSILKLDTTERARLGIFLAMQSPLSIEGVTNSEFLRTALSRVSGKQVGIYDFIKKMEKSMDDLHMEHSMMHRSLNQDFSGGERKKNEILQMKVLEPKLIILDELDSGLDVDSLKITCDNINEYLKTNKDASILIITHYTKI